MSKENGTEKWESMGDLFIELFFFYICRVVYIVLLIWDSKCVVFKSF